MKNRITTNCAAFLLVVVMCFQMATGVSAVSVKPEDTATRENVLEVLRQYDTGAYYITGVLSSVKVLGPGCKNCHALLENVQATLKEIGSTLGVEYVTDMATVASYGVMSTPALVVNEKVVSMGKVLKAGDVVKLLRKLGI